MAEPLIIRHESINIVVDANDVGDSTALREIADWLDDQDTEHMVLSISSISTIDHSSGPRLKEDRVLSAVIVNLEISQDQRNL